MEMPLYRGDWEFVIDSGLKLFGMGVDLHFFEEIKGKLGADRLLVAVSKTKPVSDLAALYEAGQRDFGENYVQELVEKQGQLAADIRWHFIGHLQRNKVKYIAPFVYLIHGIDSLPLLLEVEKQAQKQQRVIQVLLQLHIAQEESKFGLDESELQALVQYISDHPLQYVQIMGLMGMASFSSDEHLLRTEFMQLKHHFDRLGSMSVPGMHMRWLSMGMSSDYALALSCGSNLVRIGSLLFGARASF
jgi:PLP dependent protein